MTPDSHPSKKLWLYGTVIIAVALIMRLLSLGTYPLMDTSEARYAEMVRLMVETNDWITPYFDYDVPFWGKPPLFIWMSAISFKLFGINEFAARLPSLLVSIGTLWLTWKLTSFQLSRQAGKLAILILTTSAMFLVLSGALLADPVMVFSITLCLTGLWIGFHSNNPTQARRWSYLFFTGSALTLLSKSLAGLVLAGLPIFLWCLLRKQFLQLWQRLPWISGSLLAAIIALPWFIAAELKTPGMLEYMIIGEHFSRYLDSGWEGDNYGTAHIRPVGMIWPYFIAGGFPWSLILAGYACQSLWLKLRHRRPLILSEWGWFLLCWLISLLLFFTFARNMIWTYALPLMPPLAMALATIWHNHLIPALHRRVVAGACITPVLMAITIYTLINDGGKKSQKTMIQAMHAEKVSDPGELLYFNKRPFSSRFYSHGKSVLVDTADEINALINNGKTDFLATRKGDFEYLPAYLKKRFIAIYHYREWTLWKEKPEH
ncbi:glycosyltransferase family 39 protein [Endozoicomonas gorgoniicola]|uniref:Glycosyltransferase family 39 protein n=1 Tax=Endozoicomonas gorgoniicola TaxID=1234144 RepID=A0ABT3MZ71_9GAMM|nr:glycosyltransferase family 39 protein [Endozoicomonas gorgoniicola]MCW7554664.1 glycosyltransferase family 39 protein [Endozoicomonas gorgoniicola]